MKGVWGRKFFARERNPAAKRRLAAGQRRFRFLDLCIRFGKIISKVCEGFNSGAMNKEKINTLEEYRATQLQEASAINY